jgi:hypothetical protein
VTQPFWETKRGTMKRRLPCGVLSCMGIYMKEMRGGRLCVYTHRQAGIHIYIHHQNSRHTDLHQGQEDPRGRDIKTEHDVAPPEAFLGVEHHELVYALGELGEAEGRGEEEEAAVCVYMYVYVCMIRNCFGTSDQINDGAHQENSQARMKHDDARNQEI